ncbi:hypothetical protein KY362_03080 [Candidatus Woesearchaeota archaeon]|nr:hypothetical protein [Candidatus Woesearchaeota archaeon]
MEGKYSMWMNEVRGPDGYPVDMYALCTHAALEMDCHRIGKGFGWENTETLQQILEDNIPEDPENFRFTFKTMDLYSEAMYEALVPMVPWKDSQVAARQYVLRMDRLQQELGAVETLPIKRLEILRDTVLKLGKEYGKRQDIRGYSRLVA